jgi:glycosyltransferase involved in cell wall biosynthesis
MSRPAVSIAIPLYNKAAFVSAALESVLAQTFSDYEIVVVDDGSTDGGAAQLCQFNDPRLIIIKQDNAGVAAARNRAMAEARAPLVAFLDADDLWAPDHLLHLMELARRFPCAALLGNRFREFLLQPPPICTSGIVNYTLLDDYFSTCAFRPQPFFTSSCMARRTEALAIGGFSFGHSRGEDLALWIKLAAVAPVATTNFVGGWYRRGSASLTSHPLSAPDISMTTLDELITARDDWSASRRHAAREYYYRIALAHAVDCARTGDAAGATRFLQLSSGTRMLRRRLWEARLLAIAPKPIRAVFFRLSDLKQV